MPYGDTGETWAHVELVQHIKDGYVGRDLANSAYMASIDEEFGSDKDNESMVDLDGDDDMDFAEERSHDTASLLIKMQQM